MSEKKEEQLNRKLGQVYLVTVKKEGKKEKRGESARIQRETK